MKKLFWIVLLFVFANVSAQFGGNVNYRQQTRYNESNIESNFSREADLIVVVKGLANVKADNYVAIFSLHQTGKTAKEVNELLNKRIDKIMSAISGEPSVKGFVDMISFVPIYEYEVEKKLFSRNTYNEIPAGFELRKNLHIQFKKPNVLNKLITICSESEVYDLVRVDYFSDKLSEIKTQLMNKAKAILKSKIATYQEILGKDFTDFEKQITDTYKVIYPIEAYENYKAYLSSSLNLNKKGNVNQAEKSTTQYYQPVIDKEFDFVINPTILEPVIQVMYEIKYKIDEKEEIPTKNNEKQYILITPNGDLKPIF